MNAITECQEGSNSSMDDTEYKNHTEKDQEKIYYRVIVVARYFDMEKDLDSILDG